jgi:hypothetical protein
MTLDPRLKGRLKGGKVQFFCECGGQPQPATTAETGEDIVMVCSAGHPLGQWSTEEERTGELNSFAHDVRLHSARAARPATARAYRSKAESKSKTMPRGGGAKKYHPKKRGQKRSLK